jgi:hypothetical protein
MATKWRQSQRDRAAWAEFVGVHFMMSGGNIFLLQKILGHLSVKMIMRYARLALAHLEIALHLNPLETLQTT